MYVFDSDHLSILQRAAGREFDNLASRCALARAGDFYVTIISFHEQVNGWTKYVSQARELRSIVRGYAKLEGYP
jgi:tRNA(fMet)-specific endonuclease VapC